MVPGAGRRLTSRSMAAWLARWVDARTQFRGRQASPGLGAALEAVKSDRDPGLQRRRGGLQVRQFTYLVNQRSTRTAWADGSQ